MIDKIPPGIRYTLDGVFLIAIGAFVYILYPFTHGIDFGVLAGFFETAGILKFFGLILLTALGLSWLTARVVMNGDNRYRTIWLLIQLGYGKKIYGDTERLSPDEAARIRGYLARAGYNPEATDWRILWRYAAAIIVIGLILAKYVK